MLVLIDESGDCGMSSRDSPGSFVLAAAFFESSDQADACNKDIDDLRKKKGWPADFEFHFHTTSDPRRKAFLELVAEHDFCYVVSVLNKRKLTSKKWTDKTFFYREACRRLVDQVEDLIRIAHACAASPLWGKALIDDNQD